VSARLPFSRLWRDCGGAAAVEFAFCLPIFLAMVFGIIQFGLTQHDFSSVRYAMQEASRALVINPNLTQANLQALVDAELAGKTQADVTVSLAKNTTANGIIATISTSYTAQFGIPTVASFSIPYNLTVTKTLPKIT
jgi:Flp pilus assembly protein TadG